MGTTRKLLLVSNGFSTDGIRDGFLSSLPSRPNQMNVAIVPTASAEWKAKQKGAVATFEYFSTIGFKQIDFVDVEFQDPQILANYDLIYFSGGNPCYLLWHLRRTGSQLIIKQLYEQGTYMVGSSAGAMIWGKDIRIILSFDTEMDTRELTDFSGLGCIPFAVLPHADYIRQHYSNYDEATRQINKALGVNVLEIENEKGALFIDGVLDWL